jgi:GLPGLI family protein
VKIGDYQTQKAETKFGGRTWYAWFTQQVPLQDGPYKFSGLPGLIVKVQDAKGDYSFDLMQTKKLRKFSSHKPEVSLLTFRKISMRIWRKNSRKIL